MITQMQHIVVNLYYS